MARARDAPLRVRRAGGLTSCGSGRYSICRLLALFYFGEPGGDMGMFRAFYVAKTE